MPRGELRFLMPAASAAAFEAFFNHRVRLTWDTLLAENHVEGGGDHPHVGAITFNRGRGWMGGFAMRTRFLTYEPGRRAAATLVEPSGPFARWAATLIFRAAPGGSELTYLYQMHTRPRLLRWLSEPIAHRLFVRETCKRFAAMAAFLDTPAGRELAARMAHEKLAHETTAQETPA